MDAHGRLQPLLVVELLFRSKEGFDALRHVVDCVSAFADTSIELPLAKACRFGSLALLERIWTSLGNRHEYEDSKWSIRRLLHYEPHYQQFQFTYSLEEAARQKDLDMVKWLFEHFDSRYHVALPALKAAATSGALEILQFIHENDMIVDHSNESERGSSGVSDGEEGREEQDGSEEETQDDRDQEEVLEDDGENGAEREQPSQEGSDESEDDGDWRRDVGWGEELAANAADAGHNAVAMWIAEHSVHMDRAETMCAAIASGNIELVEWLMSHGVYPYKEEGIPCAARNGHLHMLEWLEHEGYLGDRTGLLVSAAEGGRTEIVRWLIELDWGEGYLDSDSDSERDQGCNCCAHFRRESTRPTHVTNVGREASLAIHTAAIVGHLEIAKYLHARVDVPLNSRQESRESYRHDKKLKELDEVLGKYHNAAKVSGQTMLFAAARGFTDVVKWLYSEFSIDPSIQLFWGYDRRTKWEYYSAIDAAARYGHLEIVQFLHDKSKEPDTLKRKRSDEDLSGCTVAAMDEAAGNNHLEVVKWLHHHRTEGCTTAAMDHAAKHGHLEMVRWLYENRSEGCTKSAMDDAAKGGHLDVVKWLHEHTNVGCTTSAMDGAASGGHLDVVKWLHHNRSEGCIADAMDGAAGCGALDVVKWLHTTRTEGCTSAAMDQAAGSGHIAVIRWLHEHRTEGCTSAAMTNAATAGMFEVMLLLLSNVTKGKCSRGRIYNFGAFFHIEDWLREQPEDINELEAA